MTVSRSEFVLRAFVVLGLIALFVTQICPHYADPDLWHEMSLARETVQAGAVPWRDSFAYTPTIFPVVHHEWGAGVIAYGLTNGFGAAGILLAKFALAAGIAALCWFTAKRRDATLIHFAALAPIAIFLSDNGFSTIRAHLYSFVFLGGLLFCLDQDREGKRSWLAPWLAMYVLWLNIHAGFLVGAGLFLLHWIEQLIRRQPHMHLLGAGIAMIGLIAVNPYGVHYYSYLLHAAAMPRPAITEWLPLLDSGNLWHVGLYGISIAVFAYVLFERGAKEFPGWVLVAILALYALKHQRMLPMYSIAWLCYVPAAMKTTKLGEGLQQLWNERRAIMLTGWGAGCLACIAVILSAQPWRLNVPNSIRTHAFYPVGAVEHLEQIGFQGNVMVPFAQGAYVSWKLHPQIKVSFDSRYEVAYPQGALEQSLDFYAANKGWRTYLQQHPTDAIIVPYDSKLNELLTSGTGGERGWLRTYQDDAYSLYLRAENVEEVAQVDRRREQIEGVFP